MNYIDYEEIKTDSDGNEYIVQNIYKSSVHRIVSSIIMIIMALILIIVSICSLIGACFITKCLIITTFIMYFVGLTAGIAGIILERRLIKSGKYIKPVDNRKKYFKERI